MAYNKNTELRLGTEGEGAVAPTTHGHRLQPWMSQRHPRVQPATGDSHRDGPSPQLMHNT